MFLESWIRRAYNGLNLKFTRRIHVHRRDTNNTVTSKNTLDDGVFVTKNQPWFYTTKTSVKNVKRESFDAAPTTSTPTGNVGFNPPWSTSNCGHPRHYRHENFEKLRPDRIQLGRSASMSCAPRLNVLAGEPPARSRTTSSSWCYLVEVVELHLGDGTPDTRGDRLA